MPSLVVAPVADAFEQEFVASHVRHIGACSSLIRSANFLLGVLGRVL
jgi:hypothetical protein